MSNSYSKYPSSGLFTPPAVPTVAETVAQKSMDVGFILLLGFVALSTGVVL
jgi:hypothetical protein